MLLAHSCNTSYLLRNLYYFFFWVITRSSITKIKLHLAIGVSFSCNVFMVPANDKRKLSGNNQNLDKDSVTGKSLRFTTFIFILPYLFFCEIYETARAR